MQIGSLGKCYCSPDSTDNMVSEGLKNNLVSPNLLDIRYQEIFDLIYIFLFVVIEVIKFCSTCLLSREIIYTYTESGTLSKDPHLGPGCINLII